MPIFFVVSKTRQKHIKEHIIKQINDTTAAIQAATQKLKKPLTTGNMHFFVSAKAERIFMFLSSKNALI
jgi:hypothetical protein